MSAWLQTKSWEEAKEAIARSKGVAIVPIGSVEQHSYHLPLGTDTYVAMTIAEEAAEKTGAVLTPPVWFGSACYFTAGIEARDRFVGVGRNDFCVFIDHHAAHGVVNLRADFNAVERSLGNIEPLVERKDAVEVFVIVGFNVAVEFRWRKKK